MLSFDAKASDDGVAPLAGAWIEMVSVALIPLTITVAPLAGAWIEISMEHDKSTSYRRAPRGRVD